MSDDTRDKIGDLEIVFNQMSEGACVNELVYDEKGIPIDYRIVAVNSAYERLTGISKTEAIGALASTLYTTGEAPFLDIYARVTQSRNSETFEFYWPPVEKHIKASAMSSRPDSFVVIFDDVTDVVNATAAAKKSEERYRSLFHGYPVGLVISRIEDGKIIDCNDYIAEILGYESREECLAQYAVEKHYHRREDRDQIAATLRKKGVVSNVEIEIKDTQGNHKFVSYTARLDKETGSIEGAAIDITKRRRVQQELYESQQRLKQSQRVSQIGHYVLDFTTGLWTSSEMLDEIFGIDESFERTFERWVQIVHKEDRKAVTDHFQNHVIANKNTFDLKYRINRHTDQQTRWMHGLGNIETLADGTLTKMFGTIQDITERRDLEERLNQSEKMQAIGHLAGGVAHDFNNQLAGIVGYSDLLREELKNAPRLARYAENILLATKRAADLTSQLLAFARKGKYVTVQIDVHKIIAEVVGILQRTIDKRITMNRELAAPRAFASGDPSQIQNAIMNLAINARDAMPDGGTMTFATQAVELDAEYCQKSSFDLIAGNYILISVTDTGSGMDAQTQKRIFEPFYTTKPQGKGTGMGLAAVYGTIKNHAGAIEVESEISQGTRMSLYLPIKENSDTGIKSLQPLSPIHRGSETILLIDDEDMVLEVASLMLVELGYSVECCKDGVDALTYYREHWAAIDLVILDMVMPQISGKTAYLKMKMINPDIIALISSGYSIDGEAQQILNEGAQGFIQKPFRKTVLGKKVAEILKSQQ